MSNQKYVVTAKPGSGNAQVRKVGDNNVHTVPKTSLPKKVQDDLRRKS